MFRYSNQNNITAINTFCKTPILNSIDTVYIKHPIYLLSIYNGSSQTNSPVQTKLHIVVG